MSTYITLIVSRILFFVFKPMTLNLSNKVLGWPAYDHKIDNLIFDRLDFMIEEEVLKLTWFENILTWFLNLRLIIVIDVVL
jgi:hypothetical protein